MSTRVACRECGESFTISPEHLGRKYRCKSCGTVNVAEERKPSGDRQKKSSTDAARRKPSQKSPQQRSTGASQKPRQPQKKRRPKPAPEPTYDEYSYEYDDTEYEAYEDYDAVEEYRPSRSRSQRSSGKKKKRSSSSISLPSIPWKRIGGLVGTALVVLFIGARVLNIVLKVGRAIGDVQSGEVTLTEQVPAGAGFQILMPGAPRFAELDAPGDEPGVTLHVETWTSPPSRGGLQVAVKRFPYPSDMLIGEEQFLVVTVASLQEEVAAKGGSVTDQGVSRLAGRQAREMAIRIPEAKNGIGIQRVTVAESYVWYVWIAADDQSLVTPSLREEVFNSFQLLNAETPTSATDTFTDLTPEPATAPTDARANRTEEEAAPLVAAPDLGALQTTATGASTFHTRRLRFKTKLLERGPSPQPYENTEPPAGVEKVAYRSEGRDLMAWFARPANVDGNVPAVVYFHGGFAFGASDFEDARPFLDAGFAVMTPTFRGENGNPGDFEMLGGEYIDACNAIRWLGNKSGIDSDHIYAFGHSVGGGISALVSLADGISLRSSGSSGGLYTPDIFGIWARQVPFDYNSYDEMNLRILFTHEDSMQRRHYGWFGASDRLQKIAAPLYESSIRFNKKLTVQIVPGDHMTSLRPAIDAYLAVIREDVLQTGGQLP